ncbi:trafficking protein [Aspergillus rambellii]|uniref:Trafficking protein n=1 Tax=Aspergillus rambellii TaxID=308745 RepID=A0A0F8W4M7_9EURO|nr:trafficking protein [Aspergillus rambellii]
MSYYFTILSPTDVPLFHIAFGTSKSGGDGIARFRFADTAQYMNQFIIHSSLDMVEEAQWMNGAMYLKHIDTYPPAAAYISAFLTPSAPGSSSYISRLSRRSRLVASRARVPSRAGVRASVAPRLVVAAAAAGGVVVIWVLRGVVAGVE